jgi:hypothetical protein
MESVTYVYYKHRSSIKVIRVYSDERAEYWYIPEGHWTEFEEQPEDILRWLRENYEPL